ncbi:bacteriophage holin [Actinopolyspora xinjiangensis]|uniref:bacteriophage holin n=1 Tax=Actinopolyspora xinjiangensis TaxID=405564 RepID=UPI001FCDAAD8|nr:bacteriophage holin [Actinopolyspora xinjiangensis]
MPYALMVGLVLVALIAPIPVVLSTLRSVRRTRSTYARVAGEVSDRIGLLRARSAGIGVALKRQ